MLQVVSRTFPFVVPDSRSHDLRLEPIRAVDKPVEPLVFNTLSASWFWVMSTECFLTPITLSPSWAATDISFAHVPSGP